MFGSRAKTTLPTPDDRPGRAAPRGPSRSPASTWSWTRRIEGPWPEGTEVLYVAMGCFWGAERIFWRQPGVVTTAAGYMGGYTPNPTYEETCTGRTGHAEAVLRRLRPGSRPRPELLLKEFWENHDPTTANRQGNDIGTAVPLRDLLDHARAGAAAASATRDAFQKVLTDNGHGTITTELRSARTPARSTSPRTTTRVPAQEPRWLLQPRAQRPDLPGRHRPPGPAPGPAGHPVGRPGGSDRRLSRAH